MSTGARKPSVKLGLPFSILIVMAIALVLAFVIRPARNGHPVGGAAPPFEVEGWLNGPGPTAEELRGKIIVLDAWAYWCQPCREFAPTLKEWQRKYHAKGVVFLGITLEGAESNSQSQAFLDSLKITWPNAYGAEKMFRALQIEGIPDLFIIDQNGKIAWTEGSSGSFEEALDRLLAHQ